MTKNGITEFFGNIENTNDFTIRKWIYSETNDLKPDLFCDLSMEFKNYCRSRVFSIQLLPKKIDEFSKILDEITKNDNDFLDILPVKYYAFENGKIQQKVGFVIPNPRFNFNCKYLYYEFLCFRNIMHELFEIIKSKEQSNKTTAPPQQIETGNTDEVKKKQPETAKPKKEFKDFFNSDINISVIEKIQSDFKDYKGKKMAHLIYLLHKDFSIINYGINSRIESRKHFVSSLKGTDLRMAGIDKYFELNDVKLNIRQFEKDPDYIDTKEKLSKTIS